MAGAYAGTQQLEVKIFTGSQKGKTLSVKNYLTSQNNVYGKPGLNIIVRIDTARPDVYTVSVYNYYRTPYLCLIIFLFLAALCVIGGKKGIKSVVGLIFTLVCVLFLFVPMLFRGYDPLLSSILAAVLTTCVTLFILNGWSAKTISAILGTMTGVVIAGAFAYAAGSLLHLSGFSTSDTDSLIVIANQTHMQIQGLLFASILIASLGAVMDVAISVASSVNEFYQLNKNMSIKELFSSGMNVGRDMMGTMSNTLILAFVGSSLTTLILLNSYNISFNQLMNMNLVSVEVIQGVTGSLAVILIVPIISFISAGLIPLLTAKGIKNKS